MGFKNQTVLITGGAQGIGFSLSKKFSRMGANVVIADNNKDTPKIAKNFDGLGYVCDVTQEKELNSFITFAEEKLGSVHCFISNAGTIFVDPDHVASAPNKTWELSWKLHVMPHVYAARRLLPGMLDRKYGYLVNTASAAGLLYQIGDAPYSASKAAAISFSEGIAISHGDEGIRSSVICPQYVASNLLGFSDPADAKSIEGLLSPEVVADKVYEAMCRGEFLILPHPEVQKYLTNKVSDYDRWIEGMRKLKKKSIAKRGSAKPLDIIHLV